MKRANGFPHVSTTMTNDELTRHLYDQPMRLLRRLAKGRVPRYFRMGKHRLIHTLLALTTNQRAQLLVDLGRLIQTAERPQPLPSHPSQSTPPLPDTLMTSTPDHPSEPVVTTSMLFEGIGVPTPKLFTPDSWQEEAIQHLATSDVIVSVPTGSGKTYVAIEAMRYARQSDQTVIYTSPLKALSNTKLTEFAQIFGADQVGILTGDRRDNLQAPILIMTTEILRNLLYDAVSGEIDRRFNTLGLVILDESQFLADPERGVVWEETIIFCPPDSRLLLLSASIGNPDEVATWITSIRSTPCHLIHHRNRSVPLRATYLDPSGTLSPLIHTRDITHGQGVTLHPETTRLFAHYENKTLEPRLRR